MFDRRPLFKPRTRPCRVSLRSCGVYCNIVCVVVRIRTVLERLFTHRYYFFLQGSNVKQGKVWQGTGILTFNIPCVLGCFWNDQFMIFSIYGVHSQKRVSCRKSAAGLLPCCHQIDIRMRSHRLLRLDDNKSAASCEQAWCRLIIWDFLSTSLIQVVSTTCSKSTNIKLQQVWFSQTFCNLMKPTDLQQAGEIHNLQQVCGVSGCVLYFYKRLITVVFSNLSFIILFLCRFSLMYRGLYLRYSPWVNN